MNYSETGYGAYTATVGQKLQGAVEPGSDERIKVLESVLTHPTHTDGFVDAGDPVRVGAIVGVAQDDAAASTDEIAIDTCGVYCLNVVASDDNGTSNVAVGDIIYINSSTGVLSKKLSGGIPFGVAVSTLTGSASAAACAVLLNGMRAYPDTTNVGLALDTETISVAGPTAASLYGTTILDGTTAAAAATLADGVVIGQLKLFSCSNSTSDPTLTVAHHATSDPEVFTYGTAGMFTLLMWNGTTWATVINTATV